MGDIQYLDDSIEKLSYVRKSPPRKSYKHSTDTGPSLSFPDVSAAASTINEQPLQTLGDHLKPALKASRARRKRNRKKKSKTKMKDISNPFGALASDDD